MYRLYRNNTCLVKRPIGPCLPFVGAPSPGRWVVVCEAFRDEGVAPTGDNAPHFVGAPPPGRFLVVCEAFRDEGVAPTGECLLTVGALTSGSPCFQRPFKG